MSREEKREQLTEYFDYLKENFKRDLVALWETCCDLCGWLDLDNISTETMVDVILDYNNSLFDDQIKAILNS